MSATDVHGVGDDGIRRPEEEHATAAPLSDFFAGDLVPGDLVYSVAVEADERLTLGATVFDEKCTPGQFRALPVRGHPVPTSSADRIAASRIA